MGSDSDQPKGELTIRTLAMPKDLNPSGDIFGGWLMSQMDVAGAIAAQWRAKGRVATVAVEAMNFHKPVWVGDVLCCYAHIQSIGITSLTVLVEAWVLPPPGRPGPHQGDRGPFHLRRPGCRREKAPCAR